MNSQGLWLLATELYMVSQLAVLLHTEICRCACLLGQIIQQRVPLCRADNQGPGYMLAPKSHIHQPCRAWSWMQDAEFSGILLDSLM